MNDVHTLPLESQNGRNPTSDELLGGRWWLSVNHCVHAIDDDPRFLDALGETLDAFQLHSERYPSAEQYLLTGETHDADCVLLDMRMPNMCGVDLLEKLESRLSSIPTLILSAYQDVPEIVAAMKHGAVDYLVKPIGERGLVAKVSAALHKNWMEKRESGDIQQRLATLSDREREVMRLFVDAKTTRQIARALAISPKTVEKHRLNIFHKMQVDSVPALIRVLWDRTR